jgi:hypothetical protein
MAYTQGTDSFNGSTTATHATMANHPIERMIQVQTAACAAVRMLILAALRNLNLTLISSSNRGKRKRLYIVFLFVIVVDQHHWLVVIRERVVSQMHRWNSRSMLSIDPANCPGDSPCRRASGGMILLIRRFGRAVLGMRHSGLAVFDSKQLSALWPADARASCVGS